ncbi:unnamed protein product [Mesocestoides corti]|uniref:UCR_hinge domain-containing protein n=1 Tax=Mesocestoides corti TaxID=53468 RepID=A0A0R3U5U2_MESCO|nr:unnamed protein product [Mesocestoides corti]
MCTPLESVTMSEDVVDPIHELRKECRETPECIKFDKLFEACSVRQPKTKESCEEELIDLIQCVDKCVGPKLFAKLK